MAKLSVNNWKSSNPNRDTGCADAGVTSCLVCPLPKCVEEMTLRELARLRRWKRYGEMAREMREEGLSVEEAAGKFRLTARTVYRTRARFGDGDPG